MDVYGKFLVLGDQNTEKEVLVRKLMSTESKPVIEIVENYKELESKGVSNSTTIMALFNVRGVFSSNLWSKLDEMYQCGHGDFLVVLTHAELLKDGEDQAVEEYVSNFALRHFHKEIKIVFVKSENDDLGKLINLMIEPGSKVINEVKGSDHGSVSVASIADQNRIELNSQVIDKEIMKLKTSSQNMINKFISDRSVIVKQVSFKVKDLEHPVSIIKGFRSGKSFKTWILEINDEALAEDKRLTNQFLEFLRVDLRGANQKIDSKKDVLTKASQKELYETALLHGEKEKSYIETSNILYEIVDEKTIDKYNEKIRKSFVNEKRLKWALFFAPGVLLSAVVTTTIFCLIEATKKATAGADVSDLSGVSNVLGSISKVLSSIPKMGTVGAGAIVLLVIYYQWVKHIAKKKHLTWFTKIANSFLAEFKVNVNELNQAMKNKYEKAVNDAIEVIQSQKI